MFVVLQVSDNVFKYDSQALLLHLHVEAVVLNACEQHHCKDTASKDSSPNSTTLLNSLNVCHSHDQPSCSLCLSHHECPRFLGYCTLCVHSNIDF